MLLQLVYGVNNVVVVVVACYVNIAICCDVAVNNIDVIVDRDDDVIIAWDDAVDDGVNNVVVVAWDVIDAVNNVPVGACYSGVAMAFWR